ncbi:hypothetical protein EMIHUDRAFT_368290, partial [Emiliania huxleyi CCMP1516]|uniref:Sulfatase-modifying factor enzyme domain-containing protein n=2 Tax=Emiliania huxleyi TaxID=2903 RepID=A0A0D3JGI6_EMIH1
MMKKPAIPKPTAAYMAAKRAECKKASPCDDDEAKEAMREQGPFWMSQATLAYNVPDSGISKNHPTIDEIPAWHENYEYNGINFADSPVKYANTMNGGGPPRLGAAGKYLAMGSFFNDSENTPPSGKYDPRHQVVGRYFLVEVKEDFSIPNPNSCL